ncbi:MAG: hypothetical protein PHY12_08440, partial [Eubacteriales bacterium]|nr:hypothetical protein [Eubacteriales bacterium]
LDHGVVLLVTRLLKGLPFAGEQHGLRGRFADGRGSGRCAFPMFRGRFRRLSRRFFVKRRAGLIQIFMDVGQPKALKFKPSFLPFTACQSVKR